MFIDFAKRKQKKSFDLKTKIGNFISIFKIATEGMILNLETLLNLEKLVWKKIPFVLENSRQKFIDKLKYLNLLKDNKKIMLTYYVQNHITSKSINDYHFQKY